MKENNVVILSEYIQARKELQTFNDKEFEYFDIKDDKITLRRLTAFCADFFIVLMLFNMIQVSYAAFVDNILVPLSYTQKSDLISGVTVVNVFIFAFIYMTYFFFTNFVFNGKTLGKKWMEIKTINEDYIYFQNVDDHQLSASQSLRRALGKFLCYISFGTFFILNVINEEKRGIADMISKSRVVSDEWFEAFEANKHHDLENVKIDVNSLDRVA